MKKILFLILFMSSAVCHAGGSVRIWDGEADYLDLFSTVVVSTIPVNISSTTAVAVLGSNADRKYLEVKNLTSGYSVYLATYAATSSTNLFALSKTQTVGSIFKMGNPMSIYTGPVYIMGYAGISTCTVTAIELD